MHKPELSLHGTPIPVDNAQGTEPRELTLTSVSLFELVELLKSAHATKLYNIIRMLHCLATRAPSSVRAHLLSNYSSLNRLSSWLKSQLSASNCNRFNTYNANLVSDKIRLVGSQEQHSTFDSFSALLRDVQMQAGVYQQPSEQSLSLQNCDQQSYRQTEQPVDHHRNVHNHAVNYGSSAFDLSQTGNAPASTHTTSPQRKASLDKTDDEGSATTPPAS